jgi:hypothetical protein
MTRSARILKWWFGGHRMTLQTLRIGGREFILLPKPEFQKLASQAQRQTADDYWTRSRPRPAQSLKGKSRFRSRKWNGKLMREIGKTTLASAPAGAGGDPAWLVAGRNSAGSAQGRPRLCDFCGRVFPVHYALSPLCHSRFTIYPGIRPAREENGNNGNRKRKEGRSELSDHFEYLRSQGWQS